eukprot:Pgem_evm1s16705
MSTTTTTTPTTTTTTTTTTTITKQKALLFGLNYENTDYELMGCVNDVINMSTWLKKHGFECETYTTNAECTAIKMVEKLFKLSVESHVQELDIVWIQYSGHGSYILDNQGDERDGYDETICPSDMMQISDDLFSELWHLFNPRTKVIFMCDSCHSGTIGDLPYSFSPDQISIKENNTLYKNRIICLSGCLDEQTSMDAYLPDIVNKDVYKYSGAMTNHLLQVLYEDEEVIADVFEIVKRLHSKLKEAGFTQIPQLTSTYELNVEPQLF